MSIRTAIVAAFTAINQFSAPIQVDNGAAAIHVSGTFTGTIALTARPAGTSLPFVDIGTSLTAAGILASSVLPGSWEFRAFATALGSGTANVTLTGSNQEGGG